MRDVIISYVIKRHVTIRYKIFSFNTCVVFVTLHNTALVSCFITFVFFPFSLVIAYEEQGKRWNQNYTGNKGQHNEKPRLLVNVGFFYLWLACTWRNKTIFKHFRIARMYSFRLIVVWTTPKSGSFKFSPPPSTSGAKVVFKCPPSARFYCKFFWKGITNDGGFLIDLFLWAICLQMWTFHL